MRPKLAAFLLCFAFCVLTLTGCGRGNPKVILYSDLDRSQVEPLLKTFMEQEGLPVEVVYASPEQIKTGMGLVPQIREDGGQKTDVYWGLGPQVAEKIKGDGILAPIQNVETARVMAEFRDENFQWVGSGGKVRVLLYNKQAVPKTQIPNSVAALTQTVWKGKCAVANPRIAGSANTHLLCYWAAYGENEAKKLLRLCKANNVQICEDEKAVADAVVSGKAAWGVTDSDVATEAVRAGKPVDYVFPDQIPYATADALGKGHFNFPTLGTPAIPHVILLFKDRPHRQEAFKLLKYLFAAQTQAKMITPFPNHFSTLTSPVEDPPGKSEGRITNPQNLKFTTLGLDKIPTLRADLLSALDEVFGSKL